jgi:hypothetical protein
MYDAFCFVSFTIKKKSNRYSSWAKESGYVYYDGGVISLSSYFLLQPCESIHQTPPRRFRFDIVFTQNARAGQVRDGIGR